MIAQYTERPWSGLASIRSVSPPTPTATPKARADIILLSNAGSTKSEDPS